MDTLQTILQSIGNIQPDTITVKVAYPVTLQDSLPFWDNPSTWLVIITIIIAIIALFLPQHLKNKNDQKNETNRLLKLKEYFLYLIQSFNEPFKLEIDDYSKIIEGIADIDNRGLGLGINAKLLFDNFVSLGRNDLYEIFITRVKYLDEDRIKHYTNIYESIEYVRVQLLRKERNFTYFMDNLNLN